MANEFATYYFQKQQSMPPKQPKLPPQERDAGRSISMPARVNAAESGHEKRIAS